MSAQQPAGWDLEVELELSRKVGGILKLFSGWKRKSTLTCSFILTPAFSKEIVIIIINSLLGTAPTQFATLNKQWLTEGG